MKRIINLEGIDPPSIADNIYELGLVIMNTVVPTMP
jgi:hypothetical protein